MNEDIDENFVRHFLSRRKLSCEQIEKISEIKNMTGAQPKEESQSQILDMETIDLTLLPPVNFRLTRKVGSDGLLVAWSTPEDNEVTGFQIYIDDKLGHRVRSSSRTKALLHGLDLQNSINLRIHSTGIDNKLSKGESVQYNPLTFISPEKSTVSAEFSRVKIHRD
ncbi:uncharacterized protein LOC111710219 [Eurytemora carolleeae]|uniref:uncharacterized protein LOC111710219 n=1 Tax=Eurytemora carolleeae TaxID=1294199 RepID=UPI000C78CFCD|nr:uncharacterized protein LOC111710219 [Eurytemora carolleeae]|eukprot:XP_023340049.1 uncharacterized protein LOC111710219 [Eurytemora affinis]